MWIFFNSWISLISTKNRKTFISKHNREKSRIYISIERWFSNFRLQRPKLICCGYQNDQTFMKTISLWACLWSDSLTIFNDFSIGSENEKHIQQRQYNTSKSLNYKNKISTFYTIVFETLIINTVLQIYIYKTGSCFRYLRRVFLKHVV